jgi:hypothetical protein
MATSAFCAVSFSPPARKAVTSFSPVASSFSRLWFPGEHFDISYAAKDKKYFSSAAFPGFQENTQYPVERVGKDKAPLSIEFVKPERFGFDRQSMDENGVAAIVCGHVGILKGLGQDIGHYGG